MKERAAVDRDRVLLPLAKKVVMSRLFGAGMHRSTIGRYELEACVGVGAMGVVYAAHDPQLDRRVALKLLKASAGDDDARARLLREARALAHMSHPNIVTVFEAGELEGRVYLAMEFVDGVTLDAWCAPEVGAQPSWRELLGVFVGAGRGLAAAHAAGIVHRDFKPGNVLVGADGAVKVLDFGLATALDGVYGGDLLATEDRGARAQEVVASALTRTGAIMGTPAYMSPEQHRGQAATEQSDQFSFCVALYEALYGRRPFICTSYAVLHDAVLAGRVRDPPRGARAPAWVRRAVLRGLALDPADRFPSMTALLVELDRGSSTLALRLAAGAGVVSTLAGLGYAGYLLTRPGRVEVTARSRGEPVAGATARIDGVALTELGGGAGEVPAGVHELEVDAPGYRVARTALAVRRGATAQLTVELQREQGVFNLDVEPGGGVVFVDGVDHGTRLRNLPVDSGVHELLVRHDGYHDRRLEWSVAADERRAGFVSLAPAVTWTWRAPDFNRAVYAPGDIDGDGRGDLIVDRTQELVAINPHDDRVLWRLEGLNHSAKLVEDLDGDGVGDLVLVREDEELAVVEARSSALPVDDGRPRALWRVDTGRAWEPRGGGALRRDLDGDGRREFVIPYIHGDRVSALDIRTGRPLWTSPRLGESIKSLGFIREGSDASGVVGVLADEQVMALEAATGAVRWRRDRVSAEDEPGRQSRLLYGLLDALRGGSSAPVFVTVSPTGAATRYRARDGAELWRAELHPSCHLPPEEHGAPRVMYCRDAERRAVIFDADTGAPRWRATDFTEIVYVPSWRGGAPAFVTPHPRGAALRSPRDGHVERVFELDAPAVGDAALHDWDGDGRRELVVVSGAGTVAAFDRAGARVGAASTSFHNAFLQPLGGDGLAMIGDAGFALFEGSRVRWSRATQKAVRATPIVDDFDGDGRRELAVAATLKNRAGHLVLALEDGALQGEAASLGHKIIRAPAVAPAPGGRRELVYLDRQGVVRFDPVGQRVTRARALPMGHASPAVADIDGDGREELVVIPWDGAPSMYVLDVESLETRWTLPLPSGAWARPVVAPARAPAEDPVIVVSLLDGATMVIDATTRAVSWSRVTAETHAVAPAVADVDGDGALELVVASPSTGDLVCLDLLRGDERWSRSGVGGERASPRVADVDGDGALEIVSASARGGLFVLDGRGRARWRFRPRPRDEEQPPASTSPVIVDLDGDGHLEIVAAFAGLGLYALDAATGALRWRYDTVGAATIEAEPVPVDVEGDGLLELVIADNGGRLTMLDAARRRPGR